MKRLRQTVLFLIVVACGGGWSGSALAQQPLQDEVSVTSPLGLPPWKHFYIDVDQNHSRLVVTMNRFRLGNPTLYIRHGAQPTFDEWDFKVENNAFTKTVEIDTLSQPGIKSGRYYISFHSTRRAAFRVTADLQATTSQRSGMGASPYDGGTTFRVWAPHADEVHVAGEFNNWHTWAHPLHQEGNGHWSFDMRGAVPNQRYMYIIRNDSNTIWKMDPREEQVDHSTGDSVIFDNQFNWTDGLFQMPPWNELVIYEMHVGTLNDTPGGGPGTFDSAIQRLNHIANSGFNAVKIMPVNEFAADFSWGYNQAFPFAIETAYGGPHGLKRFVNEAHARGIAVLIDVVHNHWGPSDLDMWQFDGWSENGRGGIYFYQDGRANTQWGDTRPDYGRGEVRSYIRDAVFNLLQEFHCDGIRWDSLLSTRTTDLGDNPEGWSLVQWINDDVDWIQPWSIMIAEDLQNNAWVTKSTGEGGAGFDSQWDASFVHPIRNVIVPPDDNGRNMWDVKSAIEHRYNGDAFQRVIYTESHDEVANGRSRVPEEIWPGNAGSWFSRKRSTLGAALVMTSPGVPMVFQGQDILEDEWFRDTDPVDWSKATTYSGINQLYTDLVRLRRNWFDHTRGLRGQHVNVFHVNDGAKVVAFHRWDQGGPGDDVIVICNFRDATWNDYRIGLPRNGLWKVRFNSDWNGYSADFGNHYTPDITAESQPWDGLNFSGTFSIAPYSVVILSQD